MKQTPARDWWSIALIGLLVQLFWATQLTQPTYMDAYYYTTNGQQLANGNGFTESIIWQFLDEPTTIPTPSHTYWMPLPSLLAAIGYTVSASFGGAQLMFWLLAGSLPLLTFMISYGLTAVRWQAWTAACLTVCGGFYARLWTQPSTFAPFAWTGGLCLLCLAYGLRRDTVTRWWLLAGMMAGLAHLTRADGGLFLLVGGGLLLVEWRQGVRYVLVNGLLLGLGYLLVMGGWFAHNWVVLGRPLTTVGTQTIFLTTYDDLFAYGRAFDWSHLQAWGWDNILQSRLRGAWLTIQSFVAVSCLIFLTPFVLWGWAYYRRRFIRPFVWYTIALSVTMSFIFTFPGGRGGFFHSSAAFWPWVLALGVAGLDRAIDWVAVRRSQWQPTQAKPIFAMGFVGLALFLSLGIGLARNDTLDEGAIYASMQTQLPETAVVMVGNPPSFYYHTKLAAVSVPNEPLPILLQAAEQYQVTHLILDANRPRPLATVYQGELSTEVLQLVMSIEGVNLYEIVTYSSGGSP